MHRWGCSSGGTIPAGAGEPLRHMVLRLLAWDHPRGCGGAVPSLVRPLERRGPSPRVRGSPCQGARHTGVSRTIPAGAGEPIGRVMDKQGPWDHPRGCGGARLAVLFGRLRTGPSPRVRGSHAIGPGGHVEKGTIPAGAGEPSRRDACSAICADHPRGCGGAVSDRLKRGVSMGPSPRVRGSQIAAVIPHFSTGTIPAGAGEPRWRSGRSRHNGDHPRGCGGAVSSGRPKRALAGPSPRVRGSRLGGVGLRRPIGTIPAGAGEPCRGRPSRGS